MAHRQVKLSKLTFPGDGYMYVICDICGRKVRQKDTVVIRDRYNLQNNLVVCKEDADKPNPQLRPFYVRERQLPNPKYVRGDVADQYLSYTSTQVPSAPRLLNVTNEALSQQIMLTWQGPDNCGDSQIIGYRVTRAQPQLSTQFIVISDTLSYDTFCFDTTGIIGTYYTYQVAAINAAGVGPYSSIFYYPSQIIDDTVEYIITDDTLYTLETDDTNLYIEMDP